MVATICATFTGANPIEMGKYYYDEQRFDGLLYWFKQAKRVNDSISSTSKTKR